MYSWNDFDLSQLKVTVTAQTQGETIFIQLHFDLTCPPLWRTHPSLKTTQVVPYVPGTLDSTFRNQHVLYVINTQTSWGWTVPSSDWNIAIRSSSFCKADFHRKSEQNEKILSNRSWWILLASIWHTFTFLCSFYAQICWTKFMNWIAKSSLSPDKHVGLAHAVYIGHSRPPLGPFVLHVLHFGPRPPFWVFLSQAKKSEFEC